MGKNMAVSHLGCRVGRAFYPGRDLERAFIAHWLQKNDRYREGEASFCDHLLWNSGFHEVSQRDLQLAATIIQWLGTNLGFHFILGVFKECGYEVRDRQTEARFAVTTTFVGTFSMN